MAFAIRRKSNASFIAKTLVLTLLMIGIMAGSVMAATINVDNGVPCDDVTGTPYCKIQAAIDAANVGDTINVAAGTYTEDLSMSEGQGKENIELAGAGQGITTIKGVATTGGPNINIHLVDGIKIHDFTIESPDLAGAQSGGITLSGQNIEIYDNTFVSNFASSDSYAVAIQTYRSQWVGDIWNIWKEHDVSGLHIHDNTFQDNGGASDNGYIGIWINRDSGSGTATIEDNTFSGIVRWGIFTERSNTLIQNNIIDITGGLRTGIGVFDWGGADANDPESDHGEPRPQENVQVLGNTVRGFDNPSWGGIVLGYDSGTDEQVLTNIDVKSNTVQNNENGILVLSSADEIESNFNFISGNVLGAKNDDAANTLNAENNYWGSNDGPYIPGVNLGTGDRVSGDVDTCPFWNAYPSGSSTACSVNYFIVDEDGLAYIDNSGVYACEASDTAYTTISAAIADAGIGSTIIVCHGDYVEDLDITKSMSIIADTASRPKITGSHMISADDVTLDSFELVTTGTAITIDSSASAINGVSITNNIFDLTASPSVGVYIGGGTPNFRVSDVTMEDNVFNGPYDKVCNPWKIGGWFGTPISCQVDDVDFVHNLVNNCSIPINLQDKSITDILIDDNIFRNTDGVVYVWGEGTPTGILSRFVFTNNDVDGTNSYGIGIDLDGATVFDDDNFGSGNMISYNDFVDISGKYGFDAVSILSTLTAYELKAENNWYGACDGPGPVGPGSGSAVSANVDYTPWLGICIHNKTNSTCVFESDEADLSANVTSSLDIEDVWFSYTIDGVNHNRTYDHRIGDIYYYTIPSSDLVGGQPVQWNVYATDAFDHTFNNSWKEFYVNRKTELTVNPLSPDGLEEWYVTEPLFTLTNPDSANIQYRWDASTALAYLGPFGLENISNPPRPDSAGTLTLSYWSNLACGVEPIQSQQFRVDLTDPRIKNLVPPNKSSVFNNRRPIIRAYVDDVYGSNSGIDLDSIAMTLDGNIVIPNTYPSYRFVGDTVDAIVNYTPEADLDLGTHIVELSASDNAGRSSSLSWFFSVNETPIFTMDVNSPEEAYYGNKRVAYDIEFSETVSLVEYIDYMDVRPRWKLLCRDCNQYGNTRAVFKTAKEGNNSIGIRATDSRGLTQEQNVSFFVDSKVPRIARTLPRRNAVSNGTGFYVKYTEDNVRSVELFWDGGENVSCDSGINQECALGYVNLSAHDGEYLNYYFQVSDYVRSVQSKPLTILIDTTHPDIQVSSPEDGAVYGRRVQFNMSVSEDVIIEYYDSSEASPRWRRLCNNCDEYGSARAKLRGLKPGTHDMLFRATDKAGQTDIQRVVFTVL